MKNCVDQSELARRTLREMITPKEKRDTYQDRHTHDRLWIVVGVGISGLILLALYFQVA